MDLIKGLEEIKKENLVSFHMPGHKGRMPTEFFDGLATEDVTEIIGSDNLQDPEGIIRETERLIEDFYGTRRSLISVNGSTGALYAAIMSSFAPGDKVIIARDSHKAVYNAIALCGASPIYVYANVSDMGFFEREDIREIISLLEDDESIRGVVITSPNYYGVIKDIERLSRYTQKTGRILIVDEAHGSHLKVDSSLSAIDMGADIVVHSFHKTLPSLTQSAVLHVAGEGIDIKRVKKFMNMAQSTSPSYVLMKSVNHAIREVANRGKTLMERLCDNIDEFRVSLAESDYDFYPNDDSTRLVIGSVKDIDFFELERTLRHDYAIQPEFAFERGLVLITSIYNTGDDFRRLSKALKEVSLPAGKRSKAADVSIRNEKRMEIRDAYFKRSESISLEEASNRVAADFVMAYPPGIPLLVPGEVIGFENIEFIKSFKGDIIGVSDNKINVTLEEQHND